MDQDGLLKELTRLDFMATDLHLYLNTHPNDKEMIYKYNCIIEKADMYREEYERTYGPLCSYRSVSDPNSWTWIDNPWPWNKSFYNRGCNYREVN